MSVRRKAGGETAARLLDWSKGQAAAERLAGHVLRADGFESIDPIHPLGGPDGLKDIVCRRQAEKWVAAVFFPHGQKPLSSIKKKVEHDAAGAARSDAVGLAFVTNQHVKSAERRRLQNALGKTNLELFHLERVASILDAPSFYGIRLEFLDIEMAKDEQIAFFAEHQSLFQETKRMLAQLLPLAEAAAGGDAHLIAAVAPKVPLHEIREFARVLDSITGTSLVSPSFVFGPHVDRLRVPLAELKDFASILGQITGTEPVATFGARPHINRLQIPLAELREFVSILEQITRASSLLGLSPVDRLHVPLDHLRKYEETLDRILKKQNRIRSPAQPRSP